MNIIVFIKRIFKYLRTHSIKQIIKRILGIKPNYSEEVEYEIWIDNNEPKKTQINEIEKFIPKYKYKFLFLVKSNFNEDLINSINSQTYSYYEIVKYSENIEIENLVAKSDADYVILIKNECIISEIMLYEFLIKIDSCRCDVIYSDSDIIEKIYDENNKVITKRMKPIFKPDFAIDTLRSKNYIGNCIAVKKEKLASTIKLNYNLNEIILDLVFKAYENNLNIVHIPKILYHDIKTDNKEDYNEELTIIDEHLKRSGLSAKVEYGKHVGQFHIKYNLKNDDDKVSIIIPNMDHIEDLKKCIESIQQSTYKNFEIIIVENNSKKAETFEYYKKLNNEKNIIIEKFKISYFNFSDIVNYGVSKASGKYIILLNNDIKIINKNWIEEMLMYAQREDVGIVGAKLLFSDDSIQHAGVVIGIRGLAGHLYREVSKENMAKYPDIDLVQNMSAVTAACFMVRKELYDLVWGFDSSFAVNFNDVDFCMKIREKGYYIVYNPNIEAYHYESKSRGVDTENSEKQKRFENEYNMFVKRWKKEIVQGDPYYNKNYRLDIDIPKINYNKIMY